jgi:hypothetical protein
MKKSLQIIIIALLIVNSGYSQSKISGVILPPKLGFNETVRTFIGEGVREKYFVRVYVLGLYMSEQSKDPEVIINADKPMSVRLQIISSMLTGETMARYIREGFSRSLSGNTKAIEDEINLICQVFTSETTKVGDIYDIHYSPGVGISASKNSKPYSFTSLNSTAKSLTVNPTDLKKNMNTLNYTKSGQVAIPGLEFKKALFGIWFSKNPVDVKLKEQIIK